MICVDVSVLAAFVLPDETAGDDLLERMKKDDVVLPAIARFEFLNLLISNERRQRLTEENVAIALAWLAELDPLYDDGAEVGTIIRLCRQHRLTAYDCAYLELALRRRVPLLTRDRALAVAAAVEGVAA